MSALARKLLIATVVLLATLLLATLMLSVLGARAFADELAQQMNRSIAMYVAARGPLLRGQVPDSLALEKLAANTMMLNPAAELYLLDPVGRVIWPSDVAGGQRIPLEPLLRMLDDDGRRGPVYGQDPRDALRERIFSIAPLRDGERLAGYVYVILGGAGHTGLVATVGGSYALRAAMGGASLLLLLAAVAAWQITRRITHPLTRLHGRVVAVGNALGVSRSPRRFDAAAPPDLEAVRDAFDSLVARIESQVHDLQSTDRMRRELFAHISHDLRTPLTAIHGYLETLQGGGGSLTRERRDHYIEVAARQCDRLRRLVERIFLLARLDAATTPVQPEPVNLAELAQDVVSRFLPAAEAAAVTVRLDFAPEAPLVSADIGLLETVFENLLDNALRHTARGGEIVLRVHVVSEPAGVTCSVRDSGSGIAAALLGQLQQPFTAGPGGRSGLGLAIVARVLALHGSRLDLSSQLGDGTEARFTIAATARSCDEPVTTVASFSVAALDSGR